MGSVHCALDSGQRAVGSSGQGAVDLSIDTKFRQL
jgi:hypothetical protein